VVVGDFNARTGSLADCESEVDPSDGFLNLPDSLCDMNVTPRYNCDKTVNKYGRMLTEFCQTTQHLIVNGRFLGDSLGYYTYMGANGCSTVDYVVVNTDMFKCVQYLNVVPAGHLSDHCMVETCFLFDNLPSQSTSVESDDNTLHPLYDRFKGGSEYREKYLMSVLDEESQNNLCVFLTESYANNKHGVNQAVNDFTNIVVEAGRYTFPVKRPKKNNIGRKKKSKIWYDRECLSSKREMRKLSRRVIKDPYCIELRNKYLAECKRYKQLTKRKQKEHKDKLVENLVEMANTNPKAFWETLDACT
jgi:hypothetical protein